MQYRENQRKQIIDNFLRECEELKYGSFEEVEVKDGVPVHAEKSKKSVRFDLNVDKS